MPLSRGITTGEGWSERRAASCSMYKLSGWCNEEITAAHADQPKAVITTAEWTE